PRFAHLGFATKIVELHDYLRILRGCFFCHVIASLVDSLQEDRTATHLTGGGSNEKTAKDHATRSKPRKPPRLGPRVRSRILYSDTRLRGHPFVGVRPETRGRSQDTFPESAWLPK